MYTCTCTCMVYVIVHVHVHVWSMYMNRVINSKCILSNIWSCTDPSATHTSLLVFNIETCAQCLSTQSVTSDLEARAKSATAAP